MERILAVYVVRRPLADAHALARYIAFEQTVELPEELVPERIRRDVVGRVESVEPLASDEGGSRVTISFAPRLAGGGLAQLLNLVYGNISIQSGIRLVELRLPDSLTAKFRGPNFGVPGLRKLLGVEGRPLLATALKPMGASHAELSDVARQFALGGGDIVKDDQNLVDDSEEAFRDRVARLQEAVAAANARTGRNTLYLPILTARQEHLESRLAFAIERGVRGFLMCPFLIGIDVARSFAEKHRLVFMAHPSFSGTFFQDRGHGMTPAILLGTLMRLAGADISIFPNFGGRFSFTRDECRELSRHLREPLGALVPAFPAPGGGMRFENLAAMSADYGTDAVFLIGGALLGHGSTVEESTRAFLDRIRGEFKETLCKPS